MLKNTVKQILLFALIITTSHLNGQINYLGLGNTMTTDLTIFNDTIYASTYNGLYKRNITFSAAMGVI